MKSLSVITLALAALCLPACSDSDTDGPSQEETPFVEGLVGHWSSATCESAGPAGFLQRDFVISAQDYKVTVNVFADDACAVPLLTLEVNGPLTVVGPSAEVTDAHEVDYTMTTRKLTPRAAMVVDGLNAAQCGNLTNWSLDVAGDITVTGCPAFGIEPNPPCAKEMDLNRVDAEGLWFGDRSSSLCTARPEKLGPLPVVKR